MQLNHAENNSLITLDEIINSEEYKILPNYPSEIKITHIYKKLAGKGLETYSLEQLTQSYEEQFADTIEDLAKLYQQIQTFIHDLAALRSIVPNDKIEVDELDLLKLANGLIVTAAERFYKERPQALPPVAEIGSFLRLAEQHAIEHFGVIDRSKENKGSESVAVETSGVFSRTFSFFWSPVSRMIYGTQATPLLMEKSLKKQKLLPVLHKA